MLDPANRERTRTPATIKAYLKRGTLLLSMATRETGIDPLTPIQFAGWFLAQEDRWSRSTVRTYRASIRECLEFLGVWKPDRSKHIAPALDLLAQVADPETGSLAAPRTIREPRRTSAGKRKSLTRDELNAVDAALAGLDHRYAFLARPYLSYTSLLGLRPSEWPTAQITGTTLIVQNGKNSNDRANGPTRIIELDAYSDGYIQGLSRFIGDLTQAVADNEWRRVHAGIRRALRAACVATRIPGLIRRPVTPYTCRHVAAARLKASKTRIEVAALLGHATDETASRHYAPRSAAKGWKPIHTRPPEGAEDLIRLRYVSFPDRANLVQRAKKDLPPPTPVP
jgi:integrase